MSSLDILCIFTDDIHRPGFSVEGSFLKNLTTFDNVEFGVSNNEAKHLLTSTRKLVELSFLAMLDSGIQYRGKRFGSFMCGTGTENFIQVRCLHLFIKHHNQHITRTINLSEVVAIRLPTEFRMFWISLALPCISIQRAVPRLRQCTSLCRRCIMANVKGRS